LKRYDKLQEEAGWLSGCLLLPREVLISFKKRNLDLTDAPSLFGVSQRMLTYRLCYDGGLTIRLLKSPTTNSTRKKARIDPGLFAGKWS